MAAAAAAETSELAKFLKEHSVHDVLAQALALKGLESIDDLAFAYPDLASLDSLFSGLSDEDMGLMGAVDPLHGVHAAKLRRSLRKPMAYPSKRPIRCLPQRSFLQCSQLSCPNRRLPPGWKTSRLSSAQMQFRIW